jgi:hypothetical protein
VTRGRNGGATRQNVECAGVRNRNPVPSAMPVRGMVGSGFLVQTGRECSHASHNYQRRIGVPGYMRMGLTPKRRPDHGA